jgi:WD40 repeat protein
MVYELSALRRFSHSALIIAIVLYAAGAIALAWWMPYRPAMTISRPSQCNMLIGFSPDGRRIAAGPEWTGISTGDRIAGVPLSNDPFWVWDLTQGYPLRVGPITGLEPQVLLALAVNPTSRPSMWWRFVDDSNWRTRFLEANPWRVEKENPEWRSQLPTLNGKASYFSQNGELVVLDSRVGKDGSEVISWTTNQRLFQLPEFLMSVVFLPDGESVIATSLRPVNSHSQPQHFVGRWNLKTGCQEALTTWTDASLVDDYQLPRTREISITGRWILETQQPGGFQNGLVVRDMVRGVAKFADESAEWFVFVDGDRFLVTTHSDPNGARPPSLRFLDLESGKWKALLLEDRSGSPFVAAQKNGCLVAASIEHYRSSPLDNWPQLASWLWSWGLDLQLSQVEVVVADASTGDAIAYLPHGPKANGVNAGYVESIQPTMAFSPDGKRLAVLADDAIRIWDLPPPRSWGLILSMPLIPAALFLVVVARRRCRLPN